MGTLSSYCLQRFQSGHDGYMWSLHVLTARSLLAKCTSSLPPAGALHTLTVKGDGLSKCDVRQLSSRSGCS
jgi:hypothetical protein